MNCGVIMSAIIIICSHLVGIINDNLNFYTALGEKLTKLYTQSPALPPSYGEYKASICINIGQGGIWLYIIPFPA